MQLLGSIFSSVSGSLAGVTAGRGRGGTRLHARRPAVQPRSVSQQSARALTGALAPLWRTLSAVQRQGWACLSDAVYFDDALGSPFHPSAYALFVSCNRNLATLGASSPLLDAPSVPSFPAFSSFTVSPVYDGYDVHVSLLGFLLSWLPPVILPFGAVLRASAPLSPAKGNFRPSDFRVVAAFRRLPSASLFFPVGVPSTFSYFPPSGQVTFELGLVDPLSGFAAPSVRASARYAFNRPNPYIPGDVTVYFEGTPEAILQGQVVEFNGDPEAGG